MFCFLSGHDWKLIATFDGCSFSDTKRPVPLSFYVCDKCAKRKSTGNKDKIHGYASTLQERWVIGGILPENQGTRFFNQKKANLVSIKGGKE